MRAEPPPCRVTVHGARTRWLRTRATGGLGGEGLGRVFWVGFVVGKCSKMGPRGRQMGTKGLQNDAPGGPWGSLGELLGPLWDVACQKYRFCQLLCHFRIAFGSQNEAKK